MLYSSIATAAALLSMASSATAAVGSAHVVNNCGVPVYYAAVTQTTSPGMAVLPAGYTLPYTLPNDGVSIKLSPTNSLSGPITQFEFTWAGGNIAYDISNINGNPFAAAGMSLTPSLAGASGYPTCVPVNCPAGQATCTAAYNNPDDVRTMVCPQASDLTMVLCSGGKLKRDEPESLFASLTRRVHARQWV